MLPGGIIRVTHTGLTVSGGLGPRSRVHLACVFASDDLAGTAWRSCCLPRTLDTTADPPPHQAAELDSQPAVSLGARVGVVWGERSPSSLDAPPPPPVLARPPPSQLFQQLLAGAESRERLAPWAFFGKRPLEAGLSGWGSAPRLCTPRFLAPPAAFLPGRRPPFLVQDFAVVSPHQLVSHVGDVSIFTAESSRSKCLSRSRSAAAPLGAAATSGALGGAGCSASRSPNCCHSGSQL